MDTATADIQTGHPWTLMFADDVFLAKPNRQEAEQLTQTWKSRLDDYGMRLNIKKTEYLEFGDQTPGSIAVDGQQLNKVTEFKYLGSCITADGDTTFEARRRANATWMKWRQTTGVMCDRKIPTRLKSKVYRTVIRPVALYGAECWPSTKKHEQEMNAMEMRMLRWSIRLTRLDRVTNVDVRKTLGVAPIQDKMKEARLRWYGHVIRSEDDSVAKTALVLSPDGKRPRGRPKKRWLDQIKEDMREANVTKEDAMDRAKWRKQCRKADPASKRDNT